MLELAQQLSYYLSVVDGGASSKLVEMGQKLASISIVAQSAQASLQSVIAPLQAIGSAWGQREMQLNSISRSLRQYQYVGQSVVGINKEIAASMPGATEDARSAAFTARYRSQFNEARQYSRGLVGEMNRLAAVLPGEMNDYMQSFSQNLPHLSAVQGMTTGRAMNLTSYLTAGGVSAGIDAGQSARDLMQALTTGAHIVDRSWTEVWSQYARVKGANGQFHRIDTAQFNRLNREGRVRVLEDIAQQLRPMMDATGDSYDALMGTFKSLRHEMYLTATEPLFDAWKRMLSSANTQLADFGPTLGVVGQFISGRFARVLDRITKEMVRLPDAVERVTKSLVAHLPAMNRVFQRVSGVAGRAYGMAHSAASTAGAGLRSAYQAAGLDSILRNVAPLLLLRVLGLSLGPLGPLLMSMFSRILLNGQLPGLLQAIGSAANRLLIGIAPVAAMLYGLYDRWMTVITNVFVEYLPGALNFAVGMILFLGNAVYSAGMFLWGLIQPELMVIQALWSLFSAFARLEMWIYSSVFGTLGSALSFIWQGLSEFHQNISNMLGPFDALRSNLILLSQVIESYFPSEQLQDRVGVQAMNEASAQMPQFMIDLQNALKAAQVQASDLNRQGHTDPNRQHRPGSHMDFRNSRFDITQKFAEGFSPDRVASAFVSDLESMAEQRLTSGFGPAFGT